MKWMLQKILRFVFADLYKEIDELKFRIDGIYQKLDLKNKARSSEKSEREIFNEWFAQAEQHIKNIKEEIQLQSGEIQAMKMNITNRNGEIDYSAAFDKKEPLHWGDECYRFANVDLENK